MKDYAAKIQQNITITPSGCHEWNRYREANGYGRTRWNNKNVLVHRLAWMLAKGSVPKGRMVCHKCDNPPCCNVDHLFLGTGLDNTRDAMRKGRMKTALAGLAVISRHRRHRLLTDAQVEEIRSSAERGVDLAVRFGCTAANVSMIRAGKRKVAPLRG